MKRFLSRLLQVASISILSSVTLIGANVHAAALTSVEDIMNDQIAGMLSNHKIKFTTPTGVDAPTDTITITFDSDFSLAAIDFSDIDLLHGPVTGLETNETLAAAAAAGTWGVGIFGQVITFTAPTDAVAGEVTASDIVTIRIGTNAVGGVNQITNPTFNGTYHININGTFGDAGGVIVNTYDTYSFSVSAVVQPPGGSGGGGGPPPPPGGGGGPPGIDGTPPIIFNVQVINITQTTAEVTWETDESADSLVGSGITVAYENGTLFNPSLVILHNTPLTGLTPDTLYHAYITSKDAVANSATTPDFTFRTLPPARPPFISNVRVVAITDSSAVVLWDTDIPATSFVDYGETGSYGDSASTAGFVVNHAVALSGLIPRTLYHFRVTSAEPGGLSDVSADNNFTTLSDISPPGNVFNFTATPGDEENVLEWTSPPDLDFSHVVIRARTDRYPTDPSDGRFVYVGSGELFVDSRLVNGTTYYYGNFAHDTSGNAASGAFAQATPSGFLPPILPPVPIPPPPVPGPGPIVPPSPPGGPAGATTTIPIVPPSGVATTTPTVPPFITTPPAPIQPRIQAYYFAGSGQIPLSPNAQGTIIAAAGRTLLIQIPISGFTIAPVSGTLTIGASMYALTDLPGQAVLAATFVPSFSEEIVEAQYELIYENGTTQSGSNLIDARSGGRVIEDPITQGVIGIPGAKITLYDAKTGLIWNGESYGQANPMKSDENGNYVFVVPNGDYLVQASKERYILQEQEVTVNNNIVAEQIILAKIIPVPLFGGILEALQSEAAKNTVSVLSMIMAAVIIANLLNAASLASLLYYIWFLFTQPFLLLGKKKRKQWGLVYNSLSKKPIDLVAVRLQDIKSGRVIQTRVTDKDGRFIFKVKKGDYLISAVRDGFDFPTEYLKNEKEDRDLVDIYHGEKIEVKEDDVILAVNIPLDPVTEEASNKKVLWRGSLRKVQHVIAILGPAVSLLGFVVAPGTLTGVLLVFQILTYLLFLRLARPKKPSGWGVIYDKKTRYPLNRAIVRIFDNKFNKLLETQVTGPNGTYGFFASKNTFFVTAERVGFETYRTEDINLTEKDSAIIDKHIALTKKK